MEVRLNEQGRNKMPNNMFSEPRFFLMVPYDFCMERIEMFHKIVEKEEQRLKLLYEAELAQAK